MTIPDAMAASPSEEEVSIADLARRIDVLGEQMNWLCENLQSLFAFAQQMSNSGGGLRGLMHLMKQGTPEINNSIPAGVSDKVGN